jgi:hypothetical protein
MSKTKRVTLNKQIASAPTLAKKWEVALHGGPPPTAIQRLPLEAFGLDQTSAHGPEWQAKAIEQLKQRFADLLLPALMRDDPRPFEELIEAMAKRRRTSVSLEEFVRRQDKARKVRPTKKEIGRRLRLALLSLRPDDLLNIRTVKAALAKEEKAFQQWHGFDFSLAPDDAWIYAVMKQLNLTFMQRGYRARWISGGKVVRTLEILHDGTPKVSGLTLGELEALGGHVCQTLIPTVKPAAPARPTGSVK